jgi:amino acid adenylation domain-containing protein
MEPETLSGLTVTPVEVNNGTTKVDLSLCVHERVDGLRLGLTYNTDLFRAATAVRMLGQFGELLTGVAADPGRRLSELPLMTDREVRALLDAGRGRVAELPERRCLHHLFEEQAARSPEAIAVVGAGRSLTYGGIDARANRLARCLCRLGARPGMLVGVCAGRSPDLLVALLGVLKAGAAYVPLDPSYPPARLAGMVEDARAGLLVVERSLLSRLPAGRARVVLLDDLDETDAFDGPTCAVEPSPSDLAYVIFTSGSTGRPKGVEVTHSAVVNLLTDLASRFGMAANDVFPALASFAFDMSVPELYLPLICGARVLLVDREVSSDGHRLLGELSAGGATLLHATPTTWSLLLEAGWNGDPAWRAFCGAEPLPKALAERLFVAGVRPLNLYGPTETTVWSTAGLLGPTERVTVGGPLTNTQVYVLDRKQRPVPEGIAGEVYIGGAGVARGYLRQPEMTAARFVPDPFANEHGSRMYRTGDRGCWRDGGVLELLGRADHQVKLRGYRVELGEIEAALAAHPDVNAAAAVIREIQPGDVRLVAYVVPAGPAAPMPDELAKWLRGRLPEYMTPSAYVTLAELPRGPAGKIDRRALPDFGSASFAARKFVAPRTPVEETVAAVWADVLRSGPVGVTDNFFQLGGHSLLATRVLSSLRETYRVELPLSALFESPTVEGLASAISQARVARQDPARLHRLLERVTAAVD